MSTVVPGATKATATPRRPGRTKAAASEPRRRRGSTAYSDMIRNTFLNRPGETLTIAEVSDTIGQDRSAVGMGLSALARRGILRRVGTGKYQLAGTVGGPAPRAGSAAARTRRGSAPQAPAPAAAPPPKPARAARTNSRATAKAEPPQGLPPQSPERGSAAPAGASSSPTTLEVVFSLPTGEILLSDREGGLWQAHRVQLVAE